MPSEPSVQRRLETLRRTCADNPSDNEAALRLAQLCSDLGRYEEAADLYKNLVERNGTNYFLLFEYGNLCFTLDRLDEAEKTFVKLSGLKPGRLEGWNNLGIVQYRKNDIDAAMVSFNKVLEIEPDNAGAVLNLGNCCERKGRTDQALAMFRKAADLRPDFSDAWFNTGNALVALGQYPEAIEAYEKAVRYRPEFASAFKNMGYAAEKAGDDAKAEQCYASAIEYAGSDCGLLVNIGNVCARGGRVDEAKAWYLKAIKADSGEPAPWMGLRDVSLFKGDIATYVKATLAVLKRLTGEELADTLSILRELKQFGRVDEIIRCAEEIDGTNGELEAEKMLAYMRTKDTRNKAETLYARLATLPGPTDHILFCLAFYDVDRNEHESALRNLMKIKTHTTSSYELMWKCMLALDRLTQAQDSLAHFLRKNPDYFHGWFLLATIKAESGNEKEAHDALLRAFENGFSDFEALERSEALNAIYRTML